MRRALIILLIFLCRPGFSQFTYNNDSIQNIINTAKTDSAKIEKIIEISFVLCKNNPEQAITLARLGLDLADKIKSEKGKGVCMANISLGFYYMGDYNRALYYQQKALNIKEKIKDTAQIAISLNNIANIYDDLKNYRKALDYYKKSIALMYSSNYEKGIASLLNNIGLMFSNLQQYDSAIYYFEKSYIANKNLNNYEGLGMVFTNLAGIYFEEGKYAKCIEYDTKALEVRQKTNDQFQIASSLNNLGNDYCRNNEADKAIDFHMKALAIGQAIGAKELIKFAYDGLSESYLSLGNYKQAYIYSDKFNDIKDSIFNEESAKSLNELSVRFETEKKEQQNIILQKENELSVKTIKQQRITTYYIISGLVGLLLFSIFVYRAYRQKQKANEIITEQKNEVEKQKSIIEKQKQLVEEHQKEILDSIRYAKRIQRALLPTEKYISKYFKK